MIPPNQPGVKEPSLKGLVFSDLVFSKASYFQTAENAKNSGRSSKVLTQGDKLNLIKARKFQQASKSNLADGQGENLESNIQGLESTNLAKTKSKTSTEGKTSKLNSLRTSKPNILPKREGSRTNSRYTRHIIKER